MHHVWHTGNAQWVLISPCSQLPQCERSSLITSCYLLSLSLSSSLRHAGRQQFNLKSAFVLASLPGPCVITAAVWCSSEKAFLVNNTLLERGGVVIVRRLENSTKQSKCSHSLFSSLRLVLPERSTRLLSPWLPCKWKEQVINIMRLVDFQGASESQRGAAGKCRAVLGGPPGPTSSPLRSHKSGMNP